MFILFICYAKCGACLAVSVGPDTGSRVVCARRLAQGVLRTGVHVVSEQQLQHAEIVHHVQRAGSGAHRDRCIRIRIHIFLQYNYYKRTVISEQHSIYRSL